MISKRLFIFNMYNGMFMKKIFLCKIKHVFYKLNTCLIVFYFSFSKMSLAAISPVAAAATIFPAFPAPSPMK